MPRHVALRTSFVLTAFVVLSILSPPLSAEIPQVISYQGKVTDSGGTPVADGNYTMRFRIYDAASGGTLEWDSGNRTVAVSGGVFNVLLGETPQPSITLPFDEDYWLLVTFAGTNQNPRQRLVSGGYAYMTSGIVPGTEVIGSVAAGTYAAIKATNTSGSGTCYGLYGQSSSTAGRGVYGNATAGSGSTYGVYGQSSSSLGHGVYGSATAGSGNTYGVHGESSSSGGRGVYGKATASTGITYGVYGVTNSSAGYGVYGYATTSTGSTYGVRGRSASNSGVGVYGEATDNSGTYTYGVRGQSISTRGTGVHGEATATVGPTYGGYFETPSSGGTGVYGTATSPSGTTYGLYGLTSSSSGRGVYGSASAASGTTYGGYFRTSSTSGRGVYGYASAGSGSSYGVYGQSASTSGTGVYGHASATSGSPYGGYFTSSSGCAVYGSGMSYGGNFQASSTTGRGVFAVAGAETGTNYGVYGRSFSTAGRGVYGEAYADDGTNYGVYGRSTSSYGRGVYGESTATSGLPYGVYGKCIAPQGKAVYGRAEGTGTTYGGYFEAQWGDNNGIGVYAGADGAGGRFEHSTPSTYAWVASGSYKISGNGSCNFIQNHPYDDSRVIVYTCPEGDEVATYTRGTGRLSNGEARVTLGETFKWVTNPDIGLTAHITPRGTWADLYVKTLSTEELVVGSHDGTGDTAFDYIVYGLRIGFEEASVVQEKEEEAYIPSMLTHREIYAKNADLRPYNALERFKRMRASMGEAEAWDLSASRMLRDAVEEYDPAVHGPAWVDREAAPSSRE